MSKDKHRKSWEEEAAADRQTAGDEASGYDTAEADEKASDYDGDERALEEESSELEKKDEEIAALKEEVTALKESMLRRQADFENYKKRMIKAQEGSYRFAIKDIAVDIMEVNDNLLRAIDADAAVVIEDEAARKAHEAFVQGVVMTSKSIEAVLQKYGVEEIDSLNQEFNPAFHEAVEIASSVDVDKDTVTTVYRKGFKMNDLVIRSARVKVTKPERSGGESENE